MTTLRVPDLVGQVDTAACDRIAAAGKKGGDDLPRRLARIDEGWQGAPQCMSLSSHSSPDEPPNVPGTVDTGIALDRADRKRPQRN